MSKRTLGWCFTLNNYTPEEEESVRGIECQYLIVGREVGEVGTKHLQGYIQFKKPGKTLVGVRKIIQRAHWEERRGTITQAIEYCKKEGSFVELGDIPVENKTKGDLEKKRWDLAYGAYAAGRYEDVPKDILCRYSQGLERAKQLLEPAIPKALDGDMEHEWVYGPPGVGKSKRVREENPEAYIKDPVTSWWTGYKDQEVVIIDDFDKYQKSQGGDMKRWLDRYPFQARVHGGQMLIRPRKIIVTSNYSPEEIWDDEVTVAAIARRVRVIHIPSEDNPKIGLYHKCFNK